MTVDLAKTPTLKNLTPVDMRRAILAVVNERGRDFVYTTRPGADEYGTCWYVEGGEGSCIIGRACVILGVPVEWLARQENTSSSDVLTALGVTSSQALFIANLAQRMQDAGATYGAVEDALGALSYMFFGFKVEFQG